MACFLLKGPRGERWQAAERPYRLYPGEAIVPGRVKYNCGPQDTTYAPEDNFESVWGDEGLLLGNVVKKVTTALHIKQCEPCKGRQHRWNRRGLEWQRKLKELI